MVANLTADYTFTSSANAASLTGPKPANVGNGDLLVAIVFSQAAFSAGQAYTPPAGWTAIQTGITGTSGGSSRPSAAYYLPVPSASGLTATSFVFGLPVTSRCGLLILRVAGADINNPAGPVGAWSPGSSASVAIPGITTNGAGNLVIALAHATGTAAQSWPTWNPPSSPWTVYNTYNTTATSGSASNDGIWVASQSVANNSIGVPDLVEAVSTQSALNGFMFAIRSPGTGHGVANSSKFNFYAFALSNHGLRHGYVNPGSKTVDQWLAAGAQYVGHRGADADYVENTVIGYRAAAAWNGDMALEVSVWRTSDGFYMVNDQGTTANKFDQTLTISASTKAQLKQLHTTVGGYPPMFLDDDILPVYGGKRIILLDSKNGTALATSELGAITDQYGGPSWWVYKGGWANSPWYTRATQNNYQSWGYWFPSDTAAGNLTASTASHWTMLGIEWDDTAAIWQQAVGYRKPILAHICSQLTQANTAFAKGATGIMASGVKAIVPNVPASTLRFLTAARGHDPVATGSGIYQFDGTNMVPKSMYQLQNGQWVLQQFKKI